MKSKLTFSCVLLLIAIINKAQYPCFNGISTNPLSPINTQLPSKINTFFNWQDSIYQVQPINNDCIRGAQMESPFFKIDNIEALRQSRDMKWEDGWELVRRGFGLTEQNTYTVDPVPNAYLILYNKYTGVLRVLLKVCRGADYNAAKITIKFDGTSQMKTDLLEFSRSVTALDKVFTTTEYSNGASYVNDNTKWFYGDFQMMYDPCTCNYKSKLNVVSNLINTSQIALEGGVTGDIYTKDVGGKAQIQKSGSFGWKEFAGAVNGKVSAVHAGINGFVTASQTFASNIGNVDTTNKKSALDNLGNFLKNNQFLKAGLTAVPWLKSAVSLVDAFIGGGKTSAGPQEVKLLPLAVNLTVKLNGTISTINQYHDVKFTNPGSKDAPLDPDIYPYYNEVLGVFNLMKAPVVFWGNTRELKTCDPQNPNNTYFNWRFRFSLDSFIYVLNPAAGVTIKKMKAAILVDASCNGNPADLKNARINGPFPFVEGRDAMTNMIRFRTDYYDMKCLNRLLLQIGCSADMSLCQIYPTPSTAPNMYLKIMMQLERNNTSSTTQDILYVITYPIKNVRDYTKATTIPPGSSCDSLIVPAASVTYVNNFCNSTQYNNLSRQRMMTPNEIRSEEKLVKDGIIVTPNPNNGKFEVRIKKQNSSLTNISIFDMNGKLIYRYNENNKGLENGYIKTLELNLVPGTYIATAATKNRILKTKLLVLKR